MLDSYRISDPRMDRVLMKFPIDIILVITAVFIVSYKIESGGISDFRMNRFLLNSPLDMVIVLTLYLTIIHVGPTIMKKRQPFSLRTTIIVYNLAQIVFNVALFLLVLSMRKQLNVWCSPPDISDSESSLLAQQAHYYYVLLKYFDLIETVFYVLRKKENQISFLHVYHHVGILAAAWGTGLYFPGGQAIFVGFYNTFVHAVMYCYYLATSWDSKYKGYVWWKKYVTILQIVQHFLIFFSVLPAVINSNCSYPKLFMFLFSFNVLTTIVLFVDFYRKAYLIKSK